MIEPQPKTGAVKPDDRSRRRLYVAQDGRCFYCGCELPPEPHRPGTVQGFGWTRDHFRPQAKGFDGQRNIVLCCPKCNNRKGSRMPSPAEIARFEELDRRLAAMKANEYASWLAPAAIQRQEKVVVTAIEAAYREAAHTDFVNSFTNPQEDPPQ